MSDNTPDWIYVDAPVAEYTTGYGNVANDQVTLTTVKKLTSTQIVLANGSRFRRDNPHREVGRRDRWTLRSELRQRGDPQVRRVLARRTASRLHQDLDELLRVWSASAGPADVLATIDQAAALVAKARQRVADLSAGDTR